MRVGTPFNPYKLFRGVFAPYWLLEHRGLSTGAKLCYIRLLGFAGKDARCYPSLETLGISLGVSERQCRDYVKELQRAGLIVVEQRGLRKTNMYLFVWTAELESLSNSVPQHPNHPDESDGILEDTPADRKSSSDQDWNSASDPDRNTCSGQDRNSIAVPSGINSLGISSSESSSSSMPLQAASRRRRKTTGLDQKSETERKEQLTKTRTTADATSSLDRSSSFEGGRDDKAMSSPECLRHAQAAKNEQQTQAEAEAGLSPRALLILEWAEQRHIRRRRDDHSYGHPDAHWSEQWGVYCQERGVREPDAVFQVMDAAKAAADRREQWRYWKYLDEQVQQAAERYVAPDPKIPAIPEPDDRRPLEHPNSEWAHVKRILAARVNPIGYANWLEHTCQIGWDSTGLRVWVPDEVTRDWLEHEYAGYVSEALAKIGGLSVQYTLQHENSNSDASRTPDEESGVTSGEIECPTPERVVVTYRNGTADYVAPGPK